MNKIELQYDIAGSPDAVFAFLTDFSQLTRWRQVESIKVEPPGALQVGTRLYSQVKGPGGKLMEFENEVTELEPARRAYSDRARGGTFLIQSSWRVQPNNGGSRILWTTEFEGKGFMKLITPIVRRSIRQGQIADLGKLQRILESPR